MPDIWYDVDAALSEVPVNLLSLIDDTDFKTREESVTYDQSGLDLLWNFTTTAGVFTQTAVTPTDTAGDYDWVNQGNGHYTIEIPASSGASINNDTEGFGYFSGFATGVLPWRGPVIGLRSAALNNVLIDGADTPATAAALATVDTNVDDLKLGLIFGSTSGTPTTTSTDTDLSGYVTGELDGRVIVFTGGTADGQAATISTYTSTNGVVTFAALTTAPAASDPFKII